MTNQLITLFSIVTILFLFSNLQIQAQCDDPFSIDWVNNATSSSCTDTIYSFTYNNESYIYLKRKDDCLAVDWSNTLYNCNSDSTCYVFGFTLPSEQCNIELLKNIRPYLIDENVIYPKEKNCKPLLQLAAEKGDVFIDDACYGVILTAPNGACFRLKVANDGSFSSEPVRCPN